MTFTPSETAEAFTVDPVAQPARVTPLRSPSPAPRAIVTDDAPVTVIPVSTVACARVTSTDLPDIPDASNTILSELVTPETLTEDTTSPSVNLTVVT